MKDRPLLSVTEIIDDETGIWAGDLTEISIHGSLDKFLKNHGKKGMLSIMDELTFLVYEVRKRFMEIQHEKQMAESSMEGSSNG